MSKTAEKMRCGLFLHFTSLVGRTTTTRTGDTVQYDERLDVIVPPSLPTFHAMSLPPQTVRIKRKKDEEPVDALCKQRLQSFSAI